MGAKIKEIRENLGWTQEELAERSGVARVTISLIESGRTKNVMSGTIKAIANALGVPVNAFFCA